MIPDLLGNVQAITILVKCGHYIKKYYYEQGPRKTLIDNEYGVFFGVFSSRSKSLIFRTSGCTLQIGESLETRLTQPYRLFFKTKLTTKSNTVLGARFVENLHSHNITKDNKLK